MVVFAVILLIFSVIAFVGTLLVDEVPVIPLAFMIFLTLYLFGY